MILYLGILVAVFVLGRSACRLKGYAYEGRDFSEPYTVFKRKTKVPAEDLYDSVQKNSTGQKHWLLPVVIFIVFFTIRGISVGKDTYNYYSYFLQLSAYSLDPFVFFKLAPKEFGYNFLNYITLLIGGNFTVLLFFESLIIFLPLHFAIRKFSVQSEFSYFSFMFLGMYLQSFNITRQYLSLGILFFAIAFIFERKFIKFGLSVLLASTFHITAIVFFLAYFVYYLRLNAKTILLFIGTLIVVILLYTPIFNLLSIIMNHDYSRYLGLNAWALDNIIFFVFYSLVFVLLYVFRGNVYKKFPEYKHMFDFFMLMFLIYIGIKLISVIYGDLIERVGLYFSVSLIFLIPFFISAEMTRPVKLKSHAENALIKTGTLIERNYLIYWLMIVVGVAFFVYIIYVRGAYDVLPYLFFFQ